MPEPAHDPFPDLFIRHQRQVYGFILTIVPNTADADDIFQEASLILWRKKDDFAPDAPGSSFVKWANAIAYNVIRNHRTARLRDRHVFSDEVTAAIAARREQRSDELDARLVAMAGCLEKLPDPDRELVRRCYDGQDSITDVASKLNTNRNAVYQRLHRIRRGLVECIDRHIKREASS